MSRVRAGAWVILLVLAGAQAWSARFYPSPDGVSYMDLSDAVLAGNFGELLNAYWSPLYPALIGVARAILDPSAYWEFGIPHLLNVLLFAVSLAGFEYFVGVLRDLGVRWDKPGLATPRGMAGAYALFGVLTLMMTPLTLPTPDLLVSAACFFTFGALLRLRHDIDVGRSAVVLGVALAVGSLAKSFIIPWAAICILTAAVALRGRSYRPAAVAGSLWLLAVVPWTAGLSMKTGHLTFGDTGRLTYVWYVNRVETPSAKLMPHAAGTSVTDSILPGIAVTPDAPGTSPVWYDPARWYQGLRPRFDLSRQTQVIGILAAEYIASMAPLFIVIAFWLVAGGRGLFAEWWARAWPVVVPALAALAAYSIVLVTSRYVAPFYTALSLIVLCGARWPERIPPVRMLLAIAVPLILMLATPDPGQPMAAINAAVGSVLIVWLARYRTGGVQIVMGVVGGVAIWMLQPYANLIYVAAMTILVILGYWMMARDIVARDEGPATAPLIRRALVASNAALVIFVGALKYQGSLVHERIEASQPNPHWTLAQFANRAGMKEGDRIALVGSPFEAYWARAARLRIVAVVPPPRKAAFNALSPIERRRLYGEFGKAGATHVVVQQLSPPDSADYRWQPVPYLGWVRSLPR